MKKKPAFLSIHLVLLAVFILLIVVIAVKLSHFGVRINQEDIERDESR